MKPSLIVVVGFVQESGINFNCEKLFKIVGKMVSVCGSLLLVLVLVFSGNFSYSFEPFPSSEESESYGEEGEYDQRTVDFNHERCQTETLSGYYLDTTHFYSVDPFLGESGILELLVRFKGGSDGHIIFTKSANLSEPAYVIIMGSYDNKVSEIRRGLQDQTVFKINTPGILSSIQFRGFLIRYNEKKGELWVYSEGSYMPLLHWKDPEPLKIRFFSFSSYVDKVVEVAFNCKPKDLHSLIFQHKPATPDPKKRKDVLKDYDRMALPNYSPERDGDDSFVTVTITSLTWTHFTINEEDQTFVLEAWPSFTWQDTALSWDNENASKEGHLHFEPDEIWVPDITLYNSANPEDLGVYGKTQCLVSKEGNVTWVPPSKFVTYCDLNLKKWPRDTQTCKITLGSWTYHSKELDMQFGTQDEEDRVKILPGSNKEDMEWELIDTQANNVSKKYDCCPNNYTSIDYTFTVQRRSTLYTYTVILPIILISIVNVVLFLLSPQSGGRVTLGAINFLVICIYLMFFRTRLPEVDHVPFIVMLYGWNLILVSISIFTAAVVSNMSRIIGQSHPPQFLRPLYNQSLMSVICLGHLLENSSTSGGSRGTSFKLGSRSVEEGASGAGAGLDGSSSGHDHGRSEWTLLAATVDRLSFFTYSTVTIVLLACLI